MFFELNRAPPPQKKIPFMEIRYRAHDVKRLHEECFPKSKLRIASFVLIGLSTVLLASGIVVGISR
jgi:hypothetical protein